MKNKIIVLPTWILIRLFLPLLPATHPWYGRKFTLRDWAEHSTEITRVFSLFFWISTFCIIILIFSLWSKV
jgi:hypothetical protein